MENQKVPQQYMDLFARKSFAHLATLMEDGTPQVTPVWIDFDGEFILVNSAVGRQKDMNIRRNRHIALSILDPDDPYRYLQVRGEVIEITENGAEEHINKMAKKYLDLDKFQKNSPDEVRVLYKIKPN